MRDCGQELDAGKGYHFADGNLRSQWQMMEPPPSLTSFRAPAPARSLPGPFVEYLGSVPAPARAKLIEDLQQTVNAAIAADIATVVSTCRKGDALLAAVPKGLVEHLPDDKVVGGEGWLCLSVNVCLDVGFLLLAVVLHVLVWRDRAGCPCRVCRRRGQRVPVWRHSHSAHWADQVPHHHKSTSAASRHGLGVCVWCDSCVCVLRLLLQIKVKKGKTKVSYTAEPSL